ncbi:hypothetical protein ICN84_07795 [Akkermansia glycaniphila]|uniref:hypothetical protein n=1 Tax=Akkermansia glycaniphila TaxID=1679444 RepID=UPI001C018C7C|nr:hypothetical protein [Akkermansia glycaniphila]MBT9449975.1 hypothetical protein [Akkermansia glycaniphila]
MQTQTTKTDYALIAQQLDELAINAQQALSIKGNFARTFAMGQAMSELKEALTEKVMVSIMKLKKTQLGFMTDERAASQYGPEISYGTEQVRDCLIHSVILGLDPVGNQWNILSGRCYVTKEGMTKLLRDMPLLSDLKLVYHPAEIKESSTSGISKSGKEHQKIEREGLVTVNISWNYDGKAGSETLQFAIRVNNGMTQDAIIGKAERKAKAWLYGYLSGIQITDGEAEEGAPMREVSPKKAAPANPLQSMTAKVAPQSAPAPSPQEDEIPMEFDAEPVIDPNLKKLENALRGAGIQKSRFFDYIRDRGIPYNGGGSWDGSDGRDPFFTPEQTAQFIENWDDIATFFNLI